MHPEGQDRQDILFDVVHATYKVDWDRIPKIPDRYQQTTFFIVVPWRTRHNSWNAIGDRLALY